MSADIERHEFVPGPRADRCAECYCPPEHSIHRANARAYADGQVIEYTIVRYADEVGARQIYIRAQSGGKPFVVHESQLRERPMRELGVAGLDDGGDDVTDALAAPELLDDGREHCPSCGAELAGWHDDRSALCEPCQDELIPWKMTPRTQQVILAALEVAGRLPAQRAECQRVATIVRSAGGIHCPDCGPHRYGKHGIGHAFSETGGE